MWRILLKASCSEACKVCWDHNKLRIFSAELCLLFDNCIISRRWTASGFIASSADPDNRDLFSSCINECLLACLKSLYIGCQCESGFTVIDVFSICLTLEPYYELSSDRDVMIGTILNGCFKSLASIIETSFIIFISCNPFKKVCSTFWCRYGNNRCITILVISISKSCNAVACLACTVIKAIRIIFIESKRLCNRIELSRIRYSSEFKAYTWISCRSCLRMLLACRASACNIALACKHDEIINWCLIIE